MPNHKIIGGIRVVMIKKTNLKNLYIRIKPPKAEVIVSAPKHISDEEIELFVLKKTTEIARVREKMLSQERQTERQYVSGESHYLWGKPYMLKVIYGKKASVEKLADRIILTVPEGATIDEKEKTLNKWYRAELIRVLSSLVEKYEKKTQLHANAYKVRLMKTKWGSCNILEKRIVLNLHLIKKPMACLEYVLVHELVHLVEKNHTNRFYALVEEFYPNWQHTIKLLEEMPLDYIK